MAIISGCPHPHTHTYTKYSLSSFFLTLTSTSLPLPLPRPHQKSHDGMNPYTLHHSSCLPSLSLSFCASNPIRISPLIHASIILQCDSLSLSLSLHTPNCLICSLPFTLLASLLSLVSLVHFLRNDFLLTFPTLLPLPITHLATSKTKTYILWVALH